MAAPEVGRRYRVYTWSGPWIGPKHGFRGKLLGTFRVTNVINNVRVTPERWMCNVVEDGHKAQLIYAVCPEDLDEPTTGQEMQIRRFECKTDGHNKFWEIKIPEGKGAYSYRTSYGRIGGTVQEAFFTDMYSRDEMQKRVEKAIREKLNKGYIEIGAKPTLTDNKVNAAKELVKKHRLLGNNNSLI